jgi:threonylcarbamoyladenosine tRNA methylthiotransferase MtaB
VTVEVVTFGCRLNACESEAIKARAAEAGLTGAVVVNSCAVTAEAVRQSRQAIRRLKREQPGRRIIVTGCAAQIAPQSYAGMAEVDAVLGNAEKLTVQAYRRLEESLQVGDIMAGAPLNHAAADHFEGHTRAFLQIQTGCDHRCTFCVIPFGRGPSRSVAVDVVVNQARRLVEKGYPELVLTGVDITAYGADFPGAPTLGGVVEAILKAVPDLKRLRLSSLDSIEVDAGLMRLIAEEERLMPHFHLSAQSGDDMILKRMKRRHTRADTIAFCDAVRRYRPEAAFGADLIAGFPTESEAMFQNSLKLVDDAGLSQLHVFGFSPRPGTPAARMPQLDPALIKARAARLRAKGDIARDRRLEAMIGSTQIVLAERGGIGRTPCNAVVETGDARRGEFLPMPITGRRGARLIGAAA